MTHSPTHSMQPHTTRGAELAQEEQDEETEWHRNKAQIKKELEQTATEIVQNVPENQKGLVRPLATTSQPGSPHIVTIKSTPVVIYEPNSEPKSIPLEVNEVFLKGTSAESTQKVEPLLQTSSEPSTPLTIKNVMDSHPVVKELPTTTPPASPSLSGPAVDIARSTKRLTLGPESPQLVFGCMDDKKTTVKKLITVCMHGDEVCGMIAVNQMIADGFFNIFELGAMSTTRVTILLGNPKGVQANKRFIDVNLNRIFLEKEIYLNRPDHSPVSHKEDVLVGRYELERVKTIADAIASCDEYIDIHSTSAKSYPFALPAMDPESELFARSFSVDFVIEKLVRSIRGTSIGWAHSLHKKAACFECGQHEDLGAIATAKRVIKRFITNQIDGTAKAVLTCAKNEVIRKGFRYIRTGGPPKSFEKVKYNELLAYDDEVGEIRCTNPTGAYVIMPTANPILGEEAWFWGEVKDTTSAEKVEQAQKERESVPTKSKLEPFQSMTAHKRPTVQVRS